ncbi:MAG: hypothetical protein MJ247_03285 [Alphaproteobacteria bacterium]|nr:hypothetical protein [Alphaproteobacteria bacterium]
MSAIEQEKFYEIHLNKQNEIMISIHKKDGKPNAPVLLYDGGEHALLYRTKSQTILLDFIAPEARPYLFKSKSIFISETENYQVVDGYEVPCRQVKNLPLDKNGVSPLLNKEQASQIDDRDLYK